MGDHFVVNTGIGKSSPSREFIISQVCLVTLSMKISLSRKFPNLQFTESQHILNNLANNITIILFYVKMALSTKKANILMIK